VRRGVTHCCGSFEVRAKAGGVFEAGLLGSASLYDIGDEIARYARTRDLCILPLVAKGDAPGSLAETVIFESGRPIIVTQPLPQTDSGARLDKVVVAWDGSRPAARALADSMRILAVAKEVRVLTLLDEKESALPGIGAEPTRYLRALPADLLIMGAFGHSRMRQFLLGGATRSMLSGPVVPVLLSH
jgi:nucleotide-binding universal stress UspA family protein